MTVAYDASAGDVAVLTLDRPQARNAIDSRTASELSDAIDRALADDEVGVLVLTGRGDAFCAGMDLKEFAGVSAPTVVGAPQHPEWGFAGIARRYVDKPVIAAVRGPAMGGGAEIALACDLIVADDSASFGFPEVTRGIIAAGGGTLRAPTAIPQKIAMELLLTGRPVRAREAYEWGLVNAVVPEGTHLDRAIALARRICANSPAAVRATKRLVHTVWGMPARDEHAWAHIADAWDEVIASRDLDEGVEAFVQKRSPVWRPAPRKDVL
ncbi:enoyl-CoA hydratase/isomerase family protein [Microbacterium sp. RD1]|uniref:enoyl-CoA hydratase/isomerase family protein n=1 Tax=Microbacterium sp. RD1 TaxID=3457313 RepID=UPI003FA552F0